MKMFARFILLICIVLGIGLSLSIISTLKHFPGYSPEKEERITQWRRNFGTIIDEQTPMKIRLLDRNANGVIDGYDDPRPTMNR